MILCFFFFQAEDGIRDAQESRGLGDVYKRQLPQEINRLAALEKLHLNSNRLTTLPDSLGELTRLRWLCASQNEISQLPITIRHCTSLEWLYMPKNKLSNLCNEIGECRALEHVHLDENLLTSLPCSLSNLHRLQLLSLNSNLITQLPDVLWDLPSLQRVLAASNQISTLPDCVRASQSVQFLELTDNPMQFPSASVCARGIGAIVNALENADTLQKQQQAAEGCGESSASARQVMKKTLVFDNQPHQSHQRSLGDGLSLDS
eukprot:TRINITY_DN11768_c0_g1_i5.p1 TRINITY_DN11768_c0_g1~~TRINITY_DN11768_c0_g1_i5.p1  ORF type:complete len:262 (+),score=60.50 TRINITY_DN11768_c0_g1_i5:51-836(+)